MAFLDNGEKVRKTGKEKNTLGNIFKKLARVDRVHFKYIVC
jgi:hypothetical protein